MARRRKDDSAINLFYGLFMQIPPWTCIPIAAAAFVLTPGLIIALAAGNKVLAGLAGIATMAGFGIALLILLAGFKAFVERRIRQKLLEKQTGIDSIRALSWSQFELLIGQIYRQQGYEVFETGGGGPDGGIDLKLRKDGLTTIVQCKQWKSWKVGVSFIRELYGVLMASRADRAIFVASGEFTKEAREFASGKPIEMIDGTELLKLVRSVRGVESVASVSDHEFETTASTAPACPKCGSSMILRTAKRGANSGSQFWGCSEYPRCRGTQAPQVG